MNRFVPRLGVALFLATGVLGGCKPSGGGSFKLPKGYDLTCRTSGDGYDWEGSTTLATGLDDMDVTVFDTGRALVDLADEAGIVWDSFLAQNGQGFADDVYGRGAYLREDVKLTKVSDSQVVVNDGGTLRLYTLVDEGVYESAEQDPSRLTFRSDGTAQLKLAPQVYEIFATTSLVSAASNGSPVQIVSEVCLEPACTSAHTTIASDGTGRIKSVTDALGYVKTFDYDGQGRLETITFPDKRVETFGYDAQGNLATVKYPGLMGGAQPTRTFTYSGWKLTAAEGPGGAMAMPTAKLTFADNGQLEALEPTDHDTTTVTVQSDTPQKGFTSLLMTDRTHLAGTNPLVMVDDPCANVQDVDGMKFGQTVARDAHHQPIGESDRDDPAQEEGQLENPTTARDRWGDINGTIDGEMGLKFVLSPTDEDGREGRAPSSYSGPDGTGKTLYAIDDTTITNLPTWAVDLPSDESWTTTIVDDTGAKNMITQGTHHAYADTGDASCPRQIIDTDKLTGLTDTSCYSADGSKLLSLTDGYGQKVTIQQVDDPKSGESLTVTLPNGEVVAEAFDQEGRLLKRATMGFNDEEDIARYANGMLQSDSLPGANVGAGGGGYQEASAIDPDSLLDTSDEDEDGTQARDEESYTYYPEGLPKEVDVNYSANGGAPVGEQSFTCPWWASTEACQ